MFRRKAGRRAAAAILAAGFLVQVLAGCKGKEIPADQDSGTGKSSVSTSEAGSGMEAETGLRLVPEGETVTLTAWRPTHTTIGTRIESWKDELSNQWLEEQTGVKIEWITPVGGTEADNLAMVVSSGEYPDLFFDAYGYYTSGAAGLLHDGIVVDLASHLEKLPNFKRELEASEIRRKESYTDDGELPSFARFAMDDLPSIPWYGILMRQDLLEQTNQEIPETYEEWHTVLTAFKETCGITKPYVLNYNGFPKMFMFTGGLGFGHGGVSQPFYQVDGTIRYAPLEDGFREYLEMMSQWYEEGLIDPDFLSMNSMSAEMTTYADVNTGSMVAPVSLKPTLKALCADPNAEYVAVPNPVKEKGDKIHISPDQTVVSPGIMISTSCENLELALQWCDVQYTEEVNLVKNYGPDESYYEQDEEGNYQFNAKVFQNEEGFAYTDMIYSIASYPMIVDNSREHVDPYEIEAGEMYSKQSDNAYNISSSVTLTTDEIDAYAPIMAEINDYVEEMQVKFILGVESFDNYDKFLQTIRDMGIEQAMGIYQGALDRYNDR